MPRQASAPDWEPEATTKNDVGSPRVRELFDADGMVMLGKLARSVADCHAKIDDLAKSWKAERRERRRGRRLQTAGLAGFFALIQGLTALLHQAGIIK